VFNLGAESGPLNIFSMTGLIWCQGIAAVPVAYLLLAPAVRMVRRELEEAAYASGATPAGTFLRIGLPAMAPALAGPMLIMFLVAMEQVDFPYILGATAGINVLGTRMLWEVTSPAGLPNMGGTAALALLILAIAIAGLVACDRLTRVMPGDRRGSSGQRMDRSWHPQWVVRLMRCLFCGYVLVAVLLPLGILVIDSAGFLTGAASPAGECCLAGFQHIAGDGRFWKGMANTMIVAVCSAGIATLIGLWIAICSANSRSRLGGILDRISVSSVGIPAMLVAFGAAVTFLSLPVGLYGTVGLLIVAYSYRIALSARMAKAGLTQVGSNLQEAAGVAGARWIRVQTKVVLPLVAPSVVASAALLFVVGMKEFTIPLMLYSPDNVVLSVLLLQLHQAGSSAAAAATGLVMTALGMLGVAGLMFADHWLARRRGER
jgi:iron(III) transport system permease protein